MRFATAASLTISFGLLSLCTVDGQAPPPALPKDKVASLERRVSELEQQIETLKKEIRELRQKLHPELPIKIVSVRGLNVDQLAIAFQKIYGDRPGIEIAPLRDVSALMIKADMETMRQVLEILAAFAW
jgi:hypothetical protein